MDQYDEIANSSSARCEEPQRDDGSSFEFRRHEPLMEDEADDADDADDHGCKNVRRFPGEGHTTTEDGV